MQQSVTHNLLNNVSRPAARRRQDLDHDQAKSKGGSPLCSVAHWLESLAGFKQSRLKRRSHIQLHGQTKPFLEAQRVSWRDYR